MNINYTDKSKLDLFLSFDWYEKQKEGLGFKFISSVEDSINKISHNPNAYPIVYSKFHRCILKKFPFSIYYFIEDKLIIIHAIFDNRLDPEKSPK